MVTRPAHTGGLRIPPQRRRRRRLEALGVLVGLAAALIPSAAPTPVIAAGELTLTFEQSTGLGHFDNVQFPGPGQDTSADDDIVRTNDIVTYRYNAGTPVGVTLSVSNPVVTVTLPRGEQFVNLIDGQPSFTDTKGNYNVVPPAFCLPGSTITYDPPTATTMPAPNYSGMTSTTWTALPRQTLTCRIKDIPSGDGFGMTIYSKVRPEVPHGTVLGPVSVLINGSNIDPQRTAELSHTVTAASKWDLSLNGSKQIGVADNTDFVKQNTEQTCTQTYPVGVGMGGWAKADTGNAGKLCYVGGFSVTLAQPNGGLGGTPIQSGNFAYTLDLSAQSIWSQPVVPGGPSVWDAVQAYNATSGRPPIVLPGGYAVQNTGGTGWVYESANSDLFPAPEGSTTIDNSARRSGTTDIAALADYSPQQFATFSVAGADTTAYTVPNVAGAPANQPVWSERGYVYTSRVFIEVPIEFIRAGLPDDLTVFQFFDALDGTTDNSVNLPTHFALDQSSLAYSSVSGMSPVTTNSYADTDGADNNYRTMWTGFVNALAVRNQWQSPYPVDDNANTPTVTEGPSTATSPSRYWAGNPAAYGPPGEAAIYKGDGVSVDGQPVLSALILEGRNYTGGATLMCQSFDNREVVIDPAVAAATPAGSLQIQHIGPTRFPDFSDVDDGGATWIYGSMYQYFGASQQAATGNLASQGGMYDRYTDFEVRYGVGSPTDHNCLQAITWYTLADIEAGTVDWDQINKVEVYLETMPGGNVAEIRTNVSIGMRVLDNAPATLIETNVNTYQRYFQISNRYGGLGLITADPARYRPLGEEFEVQPDDSVVDVFTPEAIRAAAYPVKTTANPSQWRTSTYDEVANNGAGVPGDLAATARALMGDRLTHVDMLARVDKQVQNHLADRPFVDTDLWTPDKSQHVAAQPTNATDISAEYQALTAPPIYGPASTFSYRLTPTLDANPMPAADSMIRDVLVEDCLPVGIRLDPAATMTLNGWTPWLSGSTFPYQKTPMECQPGEYYIGFYQPRVDVTVPLGPITIPVYVLGTAMSGPLINQAQISLMTSVASTTSDADPSLFTQRADRARIEIQAPDGLRVGKSTTTPLIFVDELLNVSTPYVVWDIETVNINSGREISNVDLIDYLPENGLNSSNYLGPKGFVSAAVTAGTGVQLYFTKAVVSPQNRPALIDWSDPASASNQAGGSTVWCNATNTATYPPGGNLGACPQSAAEVTGVRIFRPGVLANQDGLKVEILMSAENRVAEDTPQNTVTMRNQVTMRAAGLDVPLYSEASARWINRDVPPNPGTISGYVWDDYDHDGIWDPDEPPIPGVTVTTTGVPMWCGEMFTDPTFACPAVTLTAVTDADGHWIVVAYPGLLIDPGGSVRGPRHPYQVTFTTPDGYTITTRQPTVVGGSLAPSTSVELNADVQFVTDVNAGYFQPGTLAIAKAVRSATTGQPVTSSAPGDRLVYEVTVTNTSATRYFPAAYPAGFVDSLAELLQVADVVGEPAATSGTATLSGALITWAGTLTPGASATVTYTVEVHTTVDSIIRNIAIVWPNPDGEVPIPPTPAECRPPDCSVVETPVVVPAATTTTTLPPPTTQPQPTVPSRLPGTGSDTTSVVPLAIGLILLGLIAVQLRRRRPSPD